MNQKEEWELMSAAHRAAMGIQTLEDTHLLHKWKARLSIAPGGKMSDEQFDFIFEKMRDARRAYEE